MIGKRFESRPSDARAYSFNYYFTFYDLNHIVLVIKVNLEGRKLILTSVSIWLSTPAPSVHTRGVGPRPPAWAHCGGSALISKALDERRSLQGVRVKASDPGKAGIFSKTEMGKLRPSGEWRSKNLMLKLKLGRGVDFDWPGLTCNRESLLERKSCRSYGVMESWPATPVLRSTLGSFSDEG